MNETTDPRDRNGESQIPGGEAIARLLRLAGPRPVAPDETVARARSAAHAHWRALVRAEERRRHVLWLTVSLAAAAALVIVVGLAQRRSLGTATATAAPVATLMRAEGPVRFADGRPLAAGGSLAAGAEVETGAGGRASFTLAEGASLRLDTSSRLRLVSRTTVDLTQGAVYLDSGARGSGSASLRVSTEMGWVEDVGTQFEVRLGDGRLRVSVRRGAAALHREGRSDLAPAGVRLVAGAGDGVERQVVAPHGADWDWVLAIAPPFELEGRTLGEFLAWVSRETGWEIRFADRSIADEAPAVILHGTLEGLSPADAPTAVLPTCGLHPRLDGDTLTIERAVAGGKE